MKVHINPTRRVGDKPVTVHDPATGRPFPVGDFELPEARLSEPDVLRLFPKPGQPGGRPGGCHGDLIPAEAEAGGDPVPTDGAAPRAARRDGS